MLHDELLPLEEPCKHPDLCRNRTPGHTHLYKMGIAKWLQSRGAAREYNGGIVILNIEKYRELQDQLDQLTNLMGRREYAQRMAAEAHA